MTNENADNSNEDQAAEDVSESEILLSRIVDHQATEQDHHRFEQLAKNDSSLWRTLAHLQQEMSALSDTVVEQLVAADLVELPANRASLKHVKPFAFTGWAAAIIIAAVWFMLPVKQSSQPSLELTHDEHFDEYRGAEFVVQELDPILMDWERVNDKQIRLYIMRRIEESFIINRPIQEVIDGENLLISPAQLRKESSLPTVIDQ